MDILLKILSTIGIVLIIILIIIVLLLVYPYKYTLNINYGDRTLVVDFKYFIIKFYLTIGFSLPVSYSLKIFSKAIFDSNIDNEKNAVKNENEDSSFEDTHKVDNLSIKEKVEDGDKAIKELLIDAKNLNDKQNKEYDETHGKVNTVIDKLDGIIPRDMIYLLKKVLKELRVLLYRLSPKNYNIDISYGIKDPYMMGLSYAVLAPVMAMNDGKMTVKPKFLNDEFGATLKAERRFPLCFLLMPVLRLLIDKRIRKIIIR